MAKRVTVQAPVKITQETFDAAVKENVDEFGLSLEEAIEDAVKQFVSQGVDLDGIITKPPSSVDGISAE